MLRRIIGRSIVQCIKTDQKLLSGNSQLCLGQKRGIEHAIHSLRDPFSTTGNETILQIDAKNPFNSLNRKLALAIIEKICPSFHTALWNSYNTPSNLFIGKKTLTSREGTTQGDPLAMAMYGFAILPLMKCAAVPGLEHKWYADDGNAIGSVDDPVESLKLLKKHGRSFSYDLTKCHLITKSELNQSAREKFRDLDVQIIDGFLVLGSIIRSDESCKKFLDEKKKRAMWHSEKKLAVNSKISP